MSFKTWDQLPRVYGSAGAKGAWSRIWKRATLSGGGGVVIMGCGDSQETSPGGAGQRYVPRLRNRLQVMTGGGLSRLLAKSQGSFGGGLPPASYLLRGTQNLNHATGLTAAEIPAAATPKRLATTGLGTSYSIDYRAQKLASDVQLADQDWWGVGEAFYIRIVGLQRAGSDEIDYTVKRYADIDDNPYFSGSTIATGTTTMGLDDAAGAYVEQLVGPFTNSDPTGTPVIGAQFSSSGSVIADAPEMIAVEFVKASTVGGIALDYWAKGGYQSDDWTGNHASAGPYLRGVYPDGVDAVFIHMGSNDCYSGSVDVDTLRARLGQFVTDLRSSSWLDDPSLLILLFSETPRTNGTSAQDAVHDRIAGVAADIIDDGDDRVLLINSRLGVEQAGWSRETGATYLADDVHYNALGARLLADTEATILRDAAMASYDKTLSYLRDHSGELNFIPCDDDVSVMTSGGTLQLADTEELGTMNLTNDGSNPLPTNIDGPFDGEQAIECPNNFQINANAWNKCVDAESDRSPGDALAFGCWFRGKSDPLTTFLESSAPINCGTDKNGSRSVEYDHYSSSGTSVGQGPRVRIRGSSGTGDNVAIDLRNLGIAGGQWHHVCVVGRSIDNVGHWSAWLDGELVGSVQLDDGFDGFFDGKLKLWTDTSELGFEGAVAHAFFATNIDSEFDGAEVYAEYFESALLPVGGIDAAKHHELGLGLGV